MRVPNTLTDPVWSLQPWPLTVTVAGAAYEIPAMAAVGWLEHLLVTEPDLWALFPGCLDEDEQEEISEALFEGAVSLDDLSELILDIISTVSGRPWWVALRLIEVARASWQTLGAEMLMRGVDAAKISLSGWLDVLLLVIMRNIDPKDATMFTLKLEQVPASEISQQEEPAMSAAEFMAMA